MEMSDLLVQLKGIYILHINIARIKINNHIRQSLETDISAALSLH